MFSDIATNFRGSPIFRIRLILSNFHNHRYKLAKAKLRRMELLAISLETEKASGGSPQVERELNLIQKDINTLEYKIKQMEGDDDA